MLLDTWKALVTPLEAATSIASLKSARATIIKITSSVSALMEKYATTKEELHLFSVWYSSPAFAICNECVPTCVEIYFVHFLTLQCEMLHVQGVYPTNN